MSPMSSYLDEMSYAIEHILRTIWHEHEALARAREQLAELEEPARLAWQKVAEASEKFGSDSPEVHQLWSVAQGRGKVTIYPRIEVRDQELRVKALDLSIQAASGSLLQYAKQGISLVFGTPAEVKGGRFIGSQNIANVIWQARNQALHWEEGRHRGFKSSVTDCFLELCKIDNSLSQFEVRNVAFEVVHLLGWTTVDNFTSDMLSL